MRYKPGRRVVVGYDADVDGEPREVVVLADVKADLAAVASRKPNVVAARRVNGRSPVDTPLRFDPLAATLVQWLPYDLELPLLAEPPRSCSSGSPGWGSMSTRVPSRARSATSRSGASCCGSARTC